MDKLELLSKKMVKNTITIVSALDIYAMHPQFDSDQKARVKKLADEINKLYNDMVTGEW